MLSRLSVRCFSSARVAALKQPSWSVAKELNFPGSVHSKFTQSLDFVDPEQSPALETYRLIDLDGQQLDSGYQVPLGEEKLLKMYKDMLTISIMDTIMYDAQRQGRLSFYMVSAGEEGTSVGSSAALEPEDVMFCQYREQGAILHRGVSLKHLMSQLYGNANDEGHGMNMPVHYQSKKLNVQPISSPLASQIPHAAGAAYALKMDGKRAVSICYFGEGAASEGDFHAGLNIAATRNCPAIFFCRNNGYAISTPTLDQYRGDGIASRGIGYGMPTIRVDGNDVLAVHRVTDQARKIAIEQQRPVLIEAMSYRVAHHSTSDDSFAYRSRVEVEDWKRYDNPLSRFRKWLELKEMWSEELENEARKSLKKDILKEFSAAEKVAKPSIKYLFSEVYAEMPETLKEQRGELLDLLERYPDNYELKVYQDGIESLKSSA